MELFGNNTLEIAKHIGNGVKPKQCAMRWKWISSESDYAESTKVRIICDINRL